MEIDVFVTRFHFLNKFPKVKTTRFIAKKHLYNLQQYICQIRHSSHIESGHPRAGPTHRSRVMTCFGKKSQERRCSWHRRGRPTTSMNTIDCAKNTSHLTIPDAEITITSNSTDISLCPTAPIFDVNPGAGKFLTPVGRRCA